MCYWWEDLKDIQMIKKLALFYFEIVKLSYLSVWTLCKNLLVYKGWNKVIERITWNI